MKKIILRLIAVIICMLVALACTTDLFPQPQFTVDMSEVQMSQDVYVYTYHNQGTCFSTELVRENTYSCDIETGYWKNNYHLEITIDPSSNHVISASINGKVVKSKQIVHIDEIITSPPYQSTAVIIAREVTAKCVLTFIIFFASLLILCKIVSCEVKLNCHGTLVKTLLCGGSAINFIKKRDVAIAFVGVILSSVFAVGCDINVIIGNMTLVGKGINIYQYIATMDQRYQIQNLMWPYGQPMLLAYFIGTLPLQLGKYNFWEYNLSCYLFYKILHGSLIAVLIISVLSFLLNNKIIKAKECRSVFLWSFFNPLVFYVAIIFIQIDIFPALCLTLGCLVLSNKSAPILAGTLLGIGISCKMQCFLLAPIVILLFLCGLFRRDKLERLNAMKAGTAFIFVLIIFMSPALKANLPVSLMIQCTPQADRAWWTVIQYTEDIYFFITPGILICAMIANMINIDRKKRSETLACNALYMYGAIVLLFSFSIKSTPSTLIHCLAAFTLINVAAKDNLQRLMIGGLSILAVFEVMFTTIGDISGLLPYIGIPYTFTALVESLYGTDKWLRFFGLLFTISHAAMLTYGLLFCKKGIDVLKLDSGEYTENLS